MRLCMHLDTSKIKILTKYGALGPLNKGFNEEVNFKKIQKYETCDFMRLLYVFAGSWRPILFENCLKKICGVTVKKKCPGHQKYHQFQKICFRNLGI